MIDGLAFHKQASTTISLHYDSFFIPIFSFYLGCEVTNFQAFLSP